MRRDMRVLAAVPMVLAGIAAREFDHAIELKNKTQVPGAAPVCRFDCQPFPSTADLIGPLGAILIAVAIALLVWAYFRPAT